MGIAAAFATGLVQGFSENIDKEQARRDKQRDRINSYQDYAIKAMIEGKASEAGVNAVRDLVKKANTQIDSMEPIGPFGKRGRDIALDMASIQGALTSASDFASTVGSGEHKFGFNVDVYDFSASGKSYAAITDLNATLLGDQKNYAKLATAPAATLNRISNLYKGHASLIYNEFNKDKDKENPIKLNMDIFNGAKEFEKLMQLRGSKDYSILNMAANENGSSIAFDETDSSQFIDVNNADKYEIGYNIIGSSLGTEFDNLAPTWAAYTNLTGLVPMRNRQTWFNAARDIAQKYGELGMKIPSKPLAFSTMTPEAANELLGDIVDKISGPDEKASAVGVAYVLGVFQELDNWTPDDGFKHVDMAITNKLAASKALFGRSAKEDDFEKIKKANQEIVDVLGTPNGEAGLYGLLNMVDGDFRGPAAVDRIKGIFASVGAVFTTLASGTSSNLNRSDVSKLLPNTNIVTDAKGAELAASGAVGPDGEPVKYVTEGFIQQLNAGVEAARKRGEANPLEGESIQEAGARYARFEAIRISLAFQMARAADPSGRLSNQDIEAQLVRLGTNFDTVESMKARIEESIRDFETKQARYGAIIELVGDGTGKATVASKKLIKGIIAVDRLAKQADYTGFAQFMEQSAPATSKYDPPDMGNVSSQFQRQNGDDIYVQVRENGAPIIVDGQNVYTDIEGNVVTDIVPKEKPVSPAAAAPVEDGADPAGTPPKAGDAGDASVDTEADTAKNLAKKLEEQVEKKEIDSSIDPSTVTTVPGTNNMTGFKLKDAKTGKLLEGLYQTNPQGRFVKKGALAG